MKRSQFIRNSLLATGAVVTGGTLAANAEGSQKPENKPFNLNYGPHQGQFENHAGKNILDQIQFAYDQGFRSIEDNGFSRRPIDEQEKIGSLLAKLGMTMGVFVLDKGGNGANTLAAGKPEHVDIFLKGCRQAVELAKRSGGKFTTVVPGDFARNLPLDIQTAHVIEALRRGAEILEPHGITMVLEPLSDTPDLFLRTSTQTYLICKGVDSPSCKILYDVYHMQRNEGDIIANIDRCWDEIAYFQVGDNPGRREPTTGEINYKNVFRHIYNKGYRGVMGMEHGKSTPGKEGELRLLAAYREVDNFLG
ncbi:hydroxypyruvate isomerase [Parapedobacter composti]|uniref:Hydroxypyruvate isomerase n=1 Tax=Parapedobacter composti TaxID=623281 RepID=A0A1I1KJI9_9SPHI|nr:TIM barrel protein [Parapedobacter composti]SFC60957.1 hydroxypyruvate isomerase [Parapedobacter composti]